MIYNNELLTSSKINEYVYAFYDYWKCTRVQSKNSLHGLSSIVNLLKFSISVILRILV